MNLDFTPEQEMIRDTYRRFCEKELTPEYVRWYDENCDYLPQDMYDKFATLGTQGLTIPEAYGGQGLGMTEFAIVLEEISRKSVAAAFCVGCGLAFGARPLLDMGSEALKNKHLPRIARGEEKWSLALTEPAGGTDILGAMGEGLDAVFIAGGLAAEETGTQEFGVPDPERLAAWLSVERLEPKFTMGFLR